MRGEARCAELSDCRYTVLSVDRVNSLDELRSEFVSQSRFVAVICDVFLKLGFICFSPRLASVDVCFAGVNHIGWGE